MLKPVKIRILEIMADGKERWSNEIVSDICKEYEISMSNDVSRDYINFDLVELSTGGFLNDIGQKVDTDGLHKKGFLLHKYVITKAGKEKSESMKK